MKSKKPWYTVGLLQYIFMASLHILLSLYSKLLLLSVCVCVCAHMCEWMSMTMSDVCVLVCVCV